MGLRHTLVVGVATVLALVSAWHSGPRRWDRLGAQRVQYAAYTAVERRHAPITSVGLPPDVFDFYASFLDRGDRVYYQVLPSGYSTFMDLPTIVERLGEYYLLPSVQVTDIADATVVVSYMTDPGLLHVHFVTQKRAGLQLYFVSRIRAP